MSGNFKIALGALGGALLALVPAQLDLGFLAQCGGEADL